MWAWRGRRDGRERSVLVTAKMRPWLDVFPALRSLVVERAGVGFRDPRVSATGVDYGRYGVDYDRTDLEQFIAEFLTSPLYERHAMPADALVINVRRGDYYSVPEHRGMFGFDQVAYLRESLTASVAQQGRPGRLHVVSDGLDWCRTKLTWLEDETEALTFASPEDGPEVNFAHVATASRLIMTNSTFTYWAGYVNSARRPENAGSLWAPRFFHRGLNGRSHHLDPRWSVIEDIPGGWDS